MCHLPIFAMFETCRFKDMEAFSSAFSSVPCGYFGLKQQRRCLRQQRCCFKQQRLSPAARFASCIYAVIFSIFVDSCGIICSAVSLAPFPYLL
jgi:hypothetical protein